MTLSERLSRANLGLFTNRYYSTAKYDAQDNLNGLTHYVQDSTLKYFKAKILRAKPILDGAFYMILESSSMDFENTKRGFRCVVFDRFGDTVERPSLDEMSTTSKQALKAYESWLNSFDGESYYQEKLKQVAERKKREAQRLEEALA